MLCGNNGDRFGLKTHAPAIPQRREEIHWRGWGRGIPRYTRHGPKAIQQQGEKMSRLCPGSIYNKHHCKLHCNTSVLQFILLVL